MLASVKIRLVNIYREANASEIQQRDYILSIEKMICNVVIIVSELWDTHVPSIVLKIYLEVLKHTLPNQKQIWMQYLLHDLIVGPFIYMSVLMLAPS